MYFTDYQVFFLHRISKPYKNGQAPIYLRIQYRGKRKSLSTRLSCFPEDWNKKTGRLKEESRLAKYVNVDLNQWERKVKECFDYLQSNQPSFELNDVHDLLINGRKDPGIIEVFEERLEEMKQLVGRGYRKATLTNYKSCKKHLKAFLKKDLEREDIKIKQVGGPFIDAFLMHLRINQGCQVVTLPKIRTG